MALLVGRRSARYVPLTACAVALLCFLAESYEVHVLAPERNILRKVCGVLAAQGEATLLIVLSGIPR